MHSLQRHGAQTSVIAQYRRVARNHYPNPTTGAAGTATKNASKFLSHQDHYRALRRAIVQRKRLGITGRQDFGVSFNHNIGINVRNLGTHSNKGPFSAGYVQDAVIRFDDSGKFFTAFPQP